MDKKQFMMQLRTHLSVLPPEERNELMDDYEAHFTFALQNGKSEQEAAAELGNPAELAREAIGDRFTDYDQPHHNTGNMYAPAHNRGALSSAAIMTGLFFLNLIAIPLVISAWAIGLSIAISALGGFISPLALILDYLSGNGFYPAKAFAVFAMVGTGILLSIVSRYLFKTLIRVTVAYMEWNVRIAKGGVQ